MTQGGGWGQGECFALALFWFVATRRPTHLGRPPTPQKLNPPIFPPTRTLSAPAVRLKAHRPPRNTPTRKRPLMLTRTAQAVTITVPGSCVCRFCVACVATFIGTTCSCGNEGIPEVTCYGCITDACDYVSAAAAEWFQVNPADASGWAVEGFERLKEAVVLGDGWEQRWRIEPWEGGALSVSVCRGGVLVGPVAVRP